MTAIVLDQVDEKKRRFLIVATSAAGAVAAGGIAVPFLGSWFPSARALAAGGPVEIDVSRIEAGQQITVEWRGKPVWVLRRTPEMLAQLDKNDALLSDPRSLSCKQPDYVKGAARSIKPEVFVAVGVCTHLGCSPTLKKEVGAASDMGVDWPGGYYCPCHNSRFDLAARVFKGSPAPTNLEIPPYRYLSDARIKVGEDPKGIAMAVTNKPPVTGAGPLNGVLTWFDQRFPLMVLWKSQLTEYYAPKNFNVWYFFGSLAALVLVIQIASGIFLTMNYKPSAEHAFASVEYIMRDVPGGWIIRYIHSTGASAFFIVVYLHLARGLMYGSYRKPRELTWIFGVVIYLCLMAEAFFGYLLPWGQMSYWGAQVIINLFATIPVIGEDLSVWIRGDYNVSDATLNRFFALHVVAIPMALLGLVGAHLIALHETGSNNPDGIEIYENLDPKTGTPVDGVPFHPYYTVKDLVGVAVFLIAFCAIVFFAPEMGGYFLEYNNFIPADPLTTPAHIAPVWYFTPFYAMLRAIPSFFNMQVWGVIVMGAAVMIFFALPWLDRGRVKSIRYRGPIYRTFFTALIVSFLILGYLGVEPTNVWGEFSKAIPVVGGDYVATWVARALTVVYFAFFLLMPWYTARDREKPVPQRLT